MDDMVAKGRQPYPTKLTAEQVREIRDRLKHETCRAIAADYPVSVWAVYKIKECYTHRRVK